MTLEFSYSLNIPLKTHYQLTLISFVKGIYLLTLRALFQK